MTDQDFELIAGHPALDVLNTVQWRLDPGRREEDLQTYADVLAWAAQAGVLAQPERAALSRLARTGPEEAVAELGAFRALRETAHAALTERDGAAVEQVVAQHREALARATLVSTADHWHWSEPELTLATPRDRVVRSVVELLTSSDLAALHRCEDDACGWVYLDTSPRRNRRWCIAADCGNRNRARAFYARKKADRTRG